MGLFHQVVLVLGVLVLALAFVMMLAWFINKILFALLFPGKTAQHFRALAADASSLLLQPDLTAFHSYYGFPAPDQLRALYSDADFVTRTNFCIASEPDSAGYYIKRFLPMSVSTMEVSSMSLGLGRFAFAEDDFGNFFYLDLSEAVTGIQQVLFMDHDGGEVQIVADSLEAFRRGFLHRGGH
jgi:hypothetical protein